MKEIQPEKGLSQSGNYTEAEFDQAISDGEDRQNGIEPVEDLDPLSDKNVHGVNAITLMRIYDLLGAILTHLDEDQANAILEAHAEGKLAGPLPYLNM